jgi:hypothetical protein
MEKEFEELLNDAELRSKYYVVYKVIPTTNPCIENRTNIFIVTDEAIAKDFCKKYGFEYKEETYSLKEVFAYGRTK